MKVICNLCEEVFNENEIMIDDADIEYCPCCGESGHLMDIDEEE